MRVESDRLRQCTVRLTGSQVVRDLEIWHVGLLPYTQTESDRLRWCKVRLTGSQVVRDLEKKGLWIFERVEMSVDRVDRTRAVTTRLTKRDSTKRKSVRERLSKIWQKGFREGRNVGGPSPSDTGPHDPSNKTRPYKGKVSSRET